MSKTTADTSVGTYSMSSRLTLLFALLLCMLLSLTLWSNPAVAAAQSQQQTQQQLGQIFAKLSATPLLRAQFQQQKTLASINKNFHSTGSILFSKQNGVLWQIQQPVQADLIVTQKKVVQKTQRTLSQVDVANTPYSSVANLFLQLMAGDQTALAKNFDVIQVSYAPNQWQLALKPKSKLFKNLFERVDVQGNQFVNQVVIQEKANNSTTIKFSQHSTQAQRLTDGENALFQLAK